MFQTMDETEARHHMVTTFLAFASMLKIYRDFLSGLAQGLDLDAWSNMIDGLLAAIYKEAEEIEATMGGT
jgi:hypothetical protein